MKKAITAALAAASITVLSLTGAGTASATPDPAVCDGINAHSSYMEYLIDAAVWGKAFNWDTETQARNIAESVDKYCPWHMPGLVLPLIGLPTMTSVSDQKLIAAIRQDAFRGAVNTARLAHHRDLRNEIRPHFEAILNAIDGLTEVGKGR